MVQHLLLPKAAWSDVQALLRLDEDKLRALDELFATAESIAPHKPKFLHQVAERLQVGTAAAQAIVLVCQFLLNLTEEGALPREIVSDLREFVVQHAPSGDPDLLTHFDSHRRPLESLLTPKPERSRAQKVRSLTEGPEPMVKSFRTICELRPVFEEREGEETIVGYTSAILLEVGMSSTDGEEKQVLLNLSPQALQSLAEVVKRTEAKLAAIRQKFGPELLNE